MHRVETGSNEEASEPLVARRSVQRPLDWRRGAVLPPAPDGRVGWPWDQHHESSAVELLRQQPPRITIVTPSFNQVAFLEATIRSVLLQDYPNLEYFVVDGGSTDGSVAVLEKYSSWIDWWVSERDAGQADALNKGFARATGEVFAYLNSDDWYMPGALARVGRCFAEAGERKWLCFPVLDAWTDGRRRLVDVPARSEKYTQLCASSAAVKPHFQSELPDAGSLLCWLLGGVTAHQPGTFWTARQHRVVGGFDAALHYGFDQKFFWSLMAEGFQPKAHGGEAIARFLWHDDSKSQNADAGRENRFATELREVALEFLPYLDGTSKALLRDEYLKYRLSSVWGDFRESQSRAAALGAMLRIGRALPSAIRNRFFVSTLLRLLVHPSP